MKLDFIDGAAVKPAGNGGDFKRWNRTDSMDTYFKIHGVPDWYKDLTDQRKKTAGRERDFAAAMTDDKGSIHSEGIPNITDIVRTELKKFMHDEVLLDPFEVNFAQLDDFADLCLFQSYTKLNQPLTIHLLNGSTQLVSHIGLEDREGCGVRKDSREPLHTPAVVFSPLPPANDVIRNCDSPLPVNSGFVGLLVYVDDVLIMAPTEDLISQVKAYLDNLFIVKDLGSCAKGLFFLSSNSLQVQAFFDADWGCRIDTRCSLIGFCVFLGDVFICWKTKKQCMVPLSSAKAEYRSMVTIVCELKWISYLLHDFGVSTIDPIPFHCDNQVALHIMANTIFHERTKHLDIDYHIVRNFYNDGFIAPSFVCSKDQFADLFTKMLPGAVFSALVRKLGLFVGTPSPTCGGDADNGEHFLWDPS
ncbi:Retrovirus-related Pol polyprotein from transposon TNT 1-94 [Sesamum angolense]|uniref:Retrovirus-related Pol polyprotein from transposon TNT 1-94 n=1 Tax=Sesamum angolense TaxID=2727404 RepID=A0AAE2C3I2_9LAMI|nr:Retrovirus-related Pol polyprotein from transposon TNT 1-94 [Sesamum angolense]